MVPKVFEPLKFYCIFPFLFVNYGIFQCVPATVQNALNAPIYPGVRRGDGIDNDCDGKEGEETLNGVGRYLQLSLIIIFIIITIIIIIIIIMGMTVTNVARTRGPTHLLTFSGNKIRLN